MNKATINEVRARLADLHKQATVERSHYYVGKTLLDADEAIKSLLEAIEAAVPAIRLVAVKAPNADGEVWMHVAGDGKLGAVNLGAKERIVVQAGAAFEAYRCKAWALFDRLGLFGNEAPPAEVHFDAELRDAVEFNGHLIGTIYGDKKRRFLDGDEVRTSFITGKLPGGIYRTRNSVYKVTMHPAVKP